MVLDSVVLEYLHIRGDKSSGPGVLENFYVFEPFREEEMARSASEHHLLVNILFAKQRFMAAAEWFVRNQEWDGSWRVPAKRTFTQEIYLPPGWCSAMAQGV